MSGRSRPSSSASRPPSRPRPTGRADRSRADRSRADRRTAPGPSGRGRPTGRVRTRRRVAVGLLVSVVLVGFLLVGVFPTRAWLAQRDELRAREAELAALEREQDEIEADIERLQTPEEVERIAREEYGMVREGETAYRMLPGAVAPVDLPDSWPFTGAEDWLNR